MDLTEDSEKAMAPHSSTLAWKIPWTEEPGRLQSMGSLESDMTERLHFHFSLSCIGEGNGNPLQCSCLENPRDGEAWWAAISGVAQSRTRLKRLSSSSSSSLEGSTFRKRKGIKIWIDRLIRNSAEIDFRGRSSTSFLTSLHHSFLTCKRRIIIIPTSLDRI